MSLGDETRLVLRGTPSPVDMLNLRGGQGFVCQGPHCGNIPREQDAFCSDLCKNRFVDQALHAESGSVAQPSQPATTAMVPMQTALQPTLQP